MLGNRSQLTYNLLKSAFCQHQTCGHKLLLFSFHWELLGKTYKVLGSIQQQLPSSTFRGRIPSVFPLPYLEVGTLSKLSMIVLETE